MTDAIVYSVLTFLTAIGGGLIPIFSPSPERALKIFVSMGAGVLLGMAFNHMIPEAAHMMGHDFGHWLLAGFLILFGLEKFVMVHACDESGCHYHSVGMAAFAGLAVHGAIEGFALASSMVASKIAPLVFLGIVAHKAPTAIALTSILKLAGKSKGVLLLFLVGVAASTPIGIFAGFSLIENLHESKTAGALLGLAAGTFIYIATCDLIPEVHRDSPGRGLRMVAFVAGLLLSFIEI